MQNTRTFWLVNKDKLPTYLFSLSVNYSSTSDFPHVLLFFSLFATMVCVPPSPPLCVKFGNTALILASREGHTATVELLLGAGADKDAMDEVREA